MNNEREFLDRIIREMKTNTGKFAMKSLIGYRLSGLYRREKAVLSEYAYSESVKTDILDAFEKISASYPDVRRYIITKNNREFEIVTAKNGIKKYVKKLREDFPNDVFAVFKETSK